MDIKTKFKYGDTLHFISNDKVCSSIVQGVKIEGWANGADGWQITYLCNHEPDEKVHIKVSEHKAFKSKEDLLKSL